MKRRAHPKKSGSLRRGQRFELEIEKVVYGGSGIGRHEGKVVFVPFAAPGDTVRVRLADQKKNYARAEIVEVLQQGPDRAEPPCQHFGRCGGCQWQHLEYPRQVEFKRRILQEIFQHRFPETRGLDIRMEASPESYGYRSRTRLQTRGWGEHARVGFFRPHSHAVEDIEACMLLRDPLNDALPRIREQQAAMQPGEERQEIEIAGSADEGRWEHAECSAKLEDGFSSDQGPAPEDEPPGSLERRVGEFTYRVSPAVFFQANDFMVGSLVEAVRELVRGDGEALELFAGVGLFTLPLARRFRRVVAVESSPEAARLCERNARQAGLENVNVLCSEAADWMRAVGTVAAPAFDTVVLDPPRSGAGGNLMQVLRQWAPETIVYISCDPHTLARDIASISGQDYAIDFIRGLDMFPQTYHFETVLRLTRR